MSESSLRKHGLRATPIRAGILTFTVDEQGLAYVREMFDVMRTRYGMTAEESLEYVNDWLGPKADHRAAVIVWDAPEGVWWFHEKPEHVVRQRFEGMYWVREKRARLKAVEWEKTRPEGITVAQYLNWTQKQYEKWIEDGTLPPPSTDDIWDL